MAHGANPDRTMPAKTFAFGLDFGTSKTVLTWTKTGTVSPVVTDVRTDDFGGARTPTCLLRDPNTGETLAIGSAAAHESQRGGDGLFLANFKPHIHQGNDQAEVAAAFLKAFSELQQVRQEIEFKGNDAILVVGCPAGWLEHGKERLLSILGRVGFSDVYVLPEPVGAAFYFLANGFTAADFNRDVLIVDWGAGTFDLTVMRGGEVKASESWGSTVYGGRLFDDLFFQWFCDSVRAEAKFTDDLEGALGDTVARQMLCSIRAQALKEDFSRFLTAQSATRGAPRTSFLATHAVQAGAGEHIYFLGPFRVKDTAEFETRARNYRASRWIQDALALSAAEVREEERSFMDRLRRGEPVDLIAWAETLIDAGMRHLKVEREPLAVLTGGSSAWTWFQDLLRKHPKFGSRKRAIFTDGQPELTIGRGLGRAYAIGTYCVHLARAIEQKRVEVEAELAANIYPTLLSVLAQRIWNQMNADPTLQQDVYRFCEQAIQAEQGGTEAVRAALERRVRDFAAIPDNAAVIAQAIESFAHDAFAESMILLKERVDPNIGGLLEIAIEACNVAGEQALIAKFENLGSRVRIEPHWIGQLWSAFVMKVLDFGKDKLPPHLREQQLAREAKQMAQRFFDNFQGQLKQDIQDILSPQAWAAQVVSHVIATLDTLIAMAGIEQAPEWVGPWSRPRVQNGGASPQAG